jgi:iron complex transport system ATP-binding protein
MTILQCHDLAFSYGGTPALRNCSVSITGGTLTGIIGPNGAGKSTLLQIMAGILKPQRGIVTWRGGALQRLRATQRARQIACVPQQTMCDLAMRVRDLVALGRTPYQRGLAWETRADRAAIDRALESMDLTTMAVRPLGSLSGGERQRTLIARAIAQSPQLLLLDEPIAHLDPAYQVDLMVRLGALASRGMTIVTALHDINLAQSYCENLLVLHQGTVRAVGPTREVLTGELLEEVYDTTFVRQETLQPSGPRTRT